MPLKRSQAPWEPRDTHLSTEMGIVISSSRLGHELARRGWTHADLAQAAGVSSPTVTSALAGRPLSPRTLKRIVQALSTTPPLDGVDRLLD